MRLLRNLRLFFNLKELFHTLMKSARPHLIFQGGATLQLGPYGRATPARLHLPVIDSVFLAFWRHFPYHVILNLIAALGISMDACTAPQLTNIMHAVASLACAPGLYAARSLYVRHIPRLCGFQKTPQCEENMGRARVSWKKATRSVGGYYQAELRSRTSLLLLSFGSGSCLLSANVLSVHLDDFKRRRRGWLEEYQKLNTA